MARHSLDVSPPNPEPAGPSWDDLRIFLAVVVHGSMSGAAGALRQSQPTVARRIRALEERLGTSLFKRSPNSLELTDAGRDVFDASLPMVTAANAAQAAAARWRTEPIAAVRITAIPSVAMFLSRHSPELARAAGPAEIILLPTRRKLDLTAGEADIALRMRQLPASGDLVARKLGQVAFAMYESRSSPSGAVIAPEEDPDLSRQAAFVARFAADRTIVARIGDMPTRYHATKAGLGAACLPCWLGDTDTDLMRVSAPGDNLVEDVYLVMTARTRSPPVLARVAKSLATLFKAQHRTLLGLVS